jgi:hypothetical protein
MHLSLGPEAPIVSVQRVEVAALRAGVDHAPAGVLLASAARFWNEAPPGD